MNKVTIAIEGMMCGMCEAHICDTIREAVPSARKVKASKRKKEASFITEETVNEDSLRKAINATGYGCLSIKTEGAANV